MLVKKLRRKLFNIQRLLIIFFILLFFYLFLLPKKFYADQDLEKVNPKLRNYLINFITKLELDDLKSNKNVNKFYTINLLNDQFKNIEQQKLSNFISNLDDLFLMNLNLINLKDINLNEINLTKLNLIKKNVNNFSTIDLLNFIIKIKNYKESILNLDLFSNEFDTVIIVQIHERIFYLKLLIESLSAVQGIDRVLLIFSHDLFDLEINKLIEDIKFCKVLQIFYPYSMQLNPNKFPATSQYDCSRDINYLFAKLINCNNADYPDTFGHYREAKFSQIKHHWWWKINYVFDKLNVTKHFNGILLTLEEDHYVLPDLLFILKFLHYENIKNNRNDQFISMGTYVKDLKSLISYKNYAINRRWYGFKHNMGLALTRDLFYDKIKKYSNYFCRLDDYNWDWSLEHISKTYLATPLRTYTLIFPRVIHIGECGLHHKKDCKNFTLINELKTLIKMPNILFPKTLKIKTLENEKVLNKKKNILNGGWSDPRDIFLCLNFTI